MMGLWKPRDECRRLDCQVADQISTIQLYAHLIDAPLRAGFNALGEMLKPRLGVAGEY